MRRAHVTSGTARRALSPAALLALAVLAAPAGSVSCQHADGIVHGLDGKPAAGVIVRALAANGHTLGEVLSDAAGAFVLDVGGAIATLELDLEAVRIERTVAGGSAANVAATFAGVAHFTLRGHAVDPGGAPAAGVDLLCRDGGCHALATTTCDEHGAFVVRSNRPIADVLVDPLGWKHVEPGPFHADRGLAIDLRLVRDRYFCLRGRAVDANGAPAVGLRVQGEIDGARAAWTTVRADGMFALWTSEPLTHVAGVRGVHVLACAGPWRADATIDLDEREHAFVLVTGRVVRADGTPASGVAVFGVATAGARPPRTQRPATSTARDGSFAVYLPRYQRHLWLFQEGGNRSGSAAIEPGKPVHAIVR